MIWLGVLIGLLVGGTIGFYTCALLIAGRGPR